MRWRVIDAPGGMGYTSKEFDAKETAMILAPTVTADTIQFFKALADDTRFTIMRLLMASDLRAGEIVERLRLPQNAVSYHLRQLRAAGLLHDRRSSSDARDVYYSVDLDRLQALYQTSGDELHARLPDDGELPKVLEQHTRPLRILYLCTHNSARSQMAEGLTRHLGGKHVEVYSAGSFPSRVHPLTLELLHACDVDTSGLESKSLEQFVGQQFDYVITVCDRARDSCPTFPNDPAKIHWSFPDPTLHRDPDEQRKAFVQLRRELQTRIRYLLSLPHPATGERMRR
jgi:ArsR family transcriptional regulator, arsenate/arsenite/antimonite-responsive transcriptional repressor / arsenate reductase (thioredoxin)